MKEGWRANSQRPSWISEKIRYVSLFAVHLLSCESTLNVLSEAIMRYLNKWNTNARTSCLAQQTLSVILKSTPVEQLTQVEEIKKVVDGLVPYTERHFNRLSRLQQVTYLH